MLRRDVIEQVRDRARIDEIVGEQVTLRSGGVGSLKGLCPFHDERTPSFTVRPQVGLWYCFGCQEGGDTISFVQRADALSFTEAVEYLAGRYGIAVVYEAGDRRPERDSGHDRQRILEANRVAEAFYVENLGTAQASGGRSFLQARGFDAEAAERFGVGFAPQSWDALLRHLRGRGFTGAEIAGAGLSTPGQRGPMDRFRGRLMWPIRDLTGATIGFGARKLDEEDQGPKYLNTPETAVYHKSQVLYGADLAKREIGRQRQVVIVEGYTDVMAAHLAGVGTAIATCGTAFGSDHIRVVRRLLGDSAGSTRGEVVFTFDGDAAGRKAAMRAFAEDGRFYANTFVAIAPDGMDPCELRQRRGDEAVRALVASRTELFRFAIRSALSELDLTTTAGRVEGLRVAAPVISTIRDFSTRADYARQLSGWLGMDQAVVEREVKRAARAPRPTERTMAEPPPRVTVTSTRDLARRSGQARLERDVLIAVLQQPGKVEDYCQVVGEEAFTIEVFQEVHQAIRAASALAAPQPGREWVAAVTQAASPEIAAVVTELAVEPLPVVERVGVLPFEEVDRVGEYVRGLVVSLRRSALERQRHDLRARLAWLEGEANPGDVAALQASLVPIEAELARLREAP